MAPITQEEILTLLGQIQSGQVKLRYENPKLSWSYVYCGVVRYLADNGWTIYIFNDCDEWDYIDYVERPDGAIAEFDDIYGPSFDNPRMPLIKAFEPTDDQVEKYWDLPGEE